jgi:hypothetical protein
VKADRKIVKNAALQEKKKGRIDGKTFVRIVNNAAQLDKTSSTTAEKVSRVNVSNDDRAMFVINANKDNKSDKTEVTEGVGREVVATAVDPLVF